MQRLNSEIRIAASPQRVWQVLTDLKSYQAWNSQIVKVRGSFDAESRLRIEVKPLYYRKFRSAMNIGNVVPASRLGLTNINLLPLGLLKVDCLFSLSENEDGSTNLHLHQRYFGLLGRFFKSRHRMLEARKSCMKMNAEIKRRVEDLYKGEAADLAILSA